LTPRANVSETEGAVDEQETVEGTMSKLRVKIEDEDSARDVDF
jgi:hypothetical protein